MKVIEFIERRIAEQYLERKRNCFLKKYPQVVCFSWDLISQDINTRGRYELDECENLQNFVFPKILQKRVCLDIGANIGNHSLFFSNFFEKVISFEPDPITYRVLSLNVDNIVNIETENIGASDRKRQVTVRHNVSNIGGTKIEKDRHIFTDSGDILVKFNLDWLDEFLPKEILSKVDFIKIDIEGHEIFALTGLKHTLMSFGPVIAFECLGEEINNKTTPVIDLLKSYGYPYFYEFARKGKLNTLPKRFRVLAKVSRVIFGGQHFILRRQNILEIKDYSMLIASKYQLDSSI